MPHVLGKMLEDEKKVLNSLMRFKGIGFSTARKICMRLQFHDQLRMGEMTPRQLNALAHELGELTLENDLSRKVLDNIQRLRRIGTYRGRRHAAGLPVRGQRTRSNAQTASYLNKLHRFSGVQEYHTMNRPVYGLGNLFLIVGVQS
jgi:small subunit ribosomal protein S13